MEQLRKHTREAELLAAHSHNLLGQSEQALLACDRTGTHSGDYEYASVKDKELAISAFAARIIALSRLRRFPLAKRYLVEIYKIAGSNADESWTTAMVVSVGRALEVMTAEAEKVGLVFEDITIPFDDLPDPS